MAWSMDKGMGMGMGHLEIRRYHTSANIASGFDPTKKKAPGFRCLDAQTMPEHAHTQASSLLNCFGGYIGAQPELERLIKI